MLIFYAMFMACLFIASLYDATQKRIPNWISLIILVSGLSWNYFSEEGLGLKDSGSGFVVGLLIMLPCYIFFSMGAGDVKLMAAIGSVVGFNKELEIIVYSFLIMFVIAIFFIIIKGDLIKLLLRYKILLYGLFSGILAYQKPEATEAASYRMPLAPAISLATAYVLYPKICTLLPYCSKIALFHF